MPMDSPSQVIERFFKVMAPGFHTTVRLPPIISRKVAVAKVEEATLISCKGTWKIKLGQSSNDLVCFENGWNRFVNEHGLRMGDFAAFEHIGNMHFKVSLFNSSTCCEKVFPVVRQDEKEAHLALGPNVLERIKYNKKGRPTKAILSSQKDHHHFARKIMPYNLKPCRCPLWIPLYFWRQNGLNGKTNMILRGPSGEFVPVELKVQANKRICMGRSDWVEFCKSNKIKIGDVCLFKIIQTPQRSNTVAIDVQVLSAC